MSRGLGQIQRACLKVIEEWDHQKWPPWPTTFNIAADVYQVKPDADGNHFVSDAQHVATKRALEGLQRKGLICGIRTGISPNKDGKAERCLHWMTPAMGQRWREKLGKVRPKQLSNFDR